MFHLDSASDLELAKNRIPDNTGHKLVAISENHASFQQVRVTSRSDFSI